MGHQQKVLQLYRSILRKANEFDNYNFRTYAIRRARDGFLANRALTEPTEIAAAVAQGQRDLAMLSRQALISSMYGMPELVVEQQQI